MQNCYLTRYMLHVWKNVQRGMDIFEPAGYLRFLTWFALECIPAWNLPPYLLPDDLLPVLNHPVRPPLPLTAAMRVFGELRGLAGIGDLDTAPEEAVLATLFELLLDLLRSRRSSPDSGLDQQLLEQAAVTGPGVVECIRVFRECAPAFPTTRRMATWPPPGTGAPRDTGRWAPQADAFFSVPASAQNGSRSTDLNSPDRLVVLYRDHHTIAGLSKAGLVAKETLDAGRDLRS